MHGAEDESTAPLPHAAREGSDMKHLILAIVFLGSLSSPGMAQDTPSATAIYSQAISAMRVIEMPRYIVYRITSVHNGMSLTFRIKPHAHNLLLHIQSSMVARVQIR